MLNLYTTTDSTKL